MTPAFINEMPYRKLGRTGMDLSLLGFGTWQIGGGRWQSQPFDECVQMLQQATEVGVNVFDVASVYGQYKDDFGNYRSRSLEILARAVKGKRHNIFVCLKVGQLDEYSHRATYTPAKIVPQVQGAASVLGTDYIDICLIHAPSMQEILDGRAITVLETLRELGLVRAIGYSFENEPDHVVAALSQNVDVVMLQYNLIDQECSYAIEQAGSRGVGVLAGGPFKRGYLSGLYRSIQELPQDDDYWSWNVSRNPKKVSAFLRKSVLEMAVAGGPLELRQRALTFVATKSPVSSLIVGHRSVSEIAENLTTLSNFESSGGTT